MSARAKFIATASCLALSACASLQASTFSDVFDDDSYAPAIDDLEAAGIIEGYDDDTYKPQSTINRAEFVKIIAESRFDLVSEETDQCMIRNLKTGNTIRFPDVSAEAWYARSVCMSSEYKLIEGYPDGTFGPEKDISFVEAAKILVLTYKPAMRPGTTVWYKPYVLQLQEWSAIPSSVATLDAKITRGEMADMVYRVRGAQGLSGGHTDETETAVTPEYVEDPGYRTIPPAMLPPPVSSEDSSSSSSSDESGTGEVVEPEGASSTGVIVE